MGLLRGDKKKTVKPTVKKKSKPAKKKTGKIPPKQKRKDTDLTISTLREVIKKLDSKVPPKRMPFFLEYIRNGGKAGKAYQATHLDVTKDSANTIGARWVKDIALTDLLTLLGLGYGQIVEDLKSKQLSVRDRLYFLMKFYKLDSLQVDLRHQMEVTIISPPKSASYIPPVDIEVVPPKVVDIEKRIVKSPKKLGTVETDKIRKAAKKVVNNRKQGGKDGKEKDKRNRG